MCFKNGRYWIYHSRDFDEQDRIKCPVEQAWVSLRHPGPTVLKKKYNKKLGYKLEEDDIIKFGRVRFRVVKIGTTRRKKKEARLNKYDVSIDVSMNERLISQISRRRQSQNPPNASNNLFATSVFHSQVTPNNSIEFETIQDKIAGLVQTSGEHDFKKLRNENQCRICLGNEEDDEIDDNPLISPCK